MKVVQFYDGKNFYTNLRNYQEQNGKILSLHYDSLAKWLTKQVNPTLVSVTSEFYGVHYYTAVNGSADDDGLRRFLNILSKKDGFYIHRFETVDKQRSCPECNTLFSYQAEKGVDTMIVADMLDMSDGYDIAILLTGDSDIVPAVDILTKKGKKVYIAGWSEHDISKKLRNAAFGYIDLSKGIEHFAEEDKEFPVKELDLHSKNIEVSFVDALNEAQSRFGEGYVGTHYFLKEWRDDKLPRSIEDRRIILERLVEQGMVEIYDTEEGSKALRTLTVNF